MGAKKLNSNTYFTHDNGGRPYKVNISDNIVTVYDNYKNNLLFEILVDKIFIGKSIFNSMTEFSGGFGKKFDGNSILLEIGDRKYKFIGNNIFSFDSLFPIKEFYSPVGNNDVPYPYAIDDENNIYLLIEDVILIKPNLDIIKDKNDPYSYYYKNDLLTKDLGIVNFDKNFISFKNISEWYIGDTRYTLRYTPDPEKDYDRLIEDGQMKLVFNDKTEQILDKQMYIDLMNEFGLFKSFQKIPNINLEHN